MAQVLGTDPGLGISGDGSTLEGSTSGPIGMIERISLAGIDVGEIDITTMNTDGWREIIAGLKDSREFTLDLLYEPENMATLMAALGTTQTWTITLPDGAVFQASGFLKGLGLQAPNGDKISQPATIRMNGEPTFYEPS